LGEKLSFEGRVIVNLLPVLIAAVLSPGTRRSAAAPPGQVKVTKFRYRCLTRSALPETWKSSASEMPPPVLVGLPS
jgi:hypothetical protein